MRPGLSPRERETLRLVADGKGDRQIARELGIGERTARTHVKMIMTKLDADNRAHAVDRAWRRGLLP